ncbi:dysbindin isoform X2 [Latimeria chalumnae]|uniref:Si:ch211-253b8.5 n=1 Tax=Latimeria chalumnae TaxID=7897 RepID=H3BH01_LATCH|nr:PREDICTED: dysbindin domain-containing protein 2 isoform X2 [Latimeria chalumnae]|eukprot:XP_005986750.1 PREDICTED: dysbindin domain-containing protein 2 isoform X2 [Latimeria chalumnae]
MSAPGSNSHSIRTAAESEHAQRMLELDPAQQMKLRERQKFFEEVFQHDVDFYLSAAHLQIEHRRPPIGSISSMEVNVDMLEQLDLLDISDQEALDVFFSSGADDSSVASSLPDEHDEEVCKDGIMLKVPSAAEIKSRMSSTSSISTDPNSHDLSEEGGETPTVQSDEEAEADILLPQTINHIKGSELEDKRAQGH